MPRFFVWFQQGSEGCDYTIGCGQLLREIKGANTLEEARKRIPKIISDSEDEEGYASDHYSICKAYLLEFQEDVYPLIEDKREQIKKRRLDQEKAQKRAKLEQLKRELGET